MGNRKNAGLILGLVALAGCNFPLNFLDGFPTKESLFNLVNPKPTPTATLSDSPIPVPVESGLAGPSLGVDAIAIAAGYAKANAEILHEMLQIVFMQEPNDRAEFGNWSDTLNQGASFEGVYNGLTHSSNYRKLEQATAGASPDALRVFAEELAFLERELPVPTSFNSITATPIVSNTARPGTVPAPQEYVKAFVGASIFTLKRVVCDEAIKVVDSKNQYREKLANWYAQWAVRLIQRNVDFGVGLRNTPNEAFHYKWALQSSDDRIKWEVLNRIQRILNEANRHTQ